MEIKQNVNIHNRFDVHIDNIETGEHRELVGYNIILDQMWTRLCEGSGYFSYIHFGTGTGTPTPERTRLFSHLGTRRAVTEETIKAFPVSSWKRKIVLNPEEFVGSTITEVGIAHYSSSNDLVTHAMLKDSEGNPISFTKTSTDVVTIYATVFITLTNTIPELKWIGMPYNNQLINYLTGSNAPSGSFGLSTIENPASKLGTSPTVTWTSDAPNRKRKTNTVRFGTTSGNGNIKYLDFTNLFRLELPAPGIFSGQPYTDVNVGSGDGVTKSFILPSANIRQSSLVIKKNGLTVSNYITNIKNQERNSRIANPASLPKDASDVALTPDGTVMAAAHWDSPQVTTYDWINEEWVKRPDPASRPAGVCNGVALTPDGLTVAVAHRSSPYVTTYDWIEGAWVKRPNPASLPTSECYGVALTHDGTVMAVAYDNSPYVITYDWIEGAWVRRPNPASRPASTGNGVALTPDGTVMAVAHYGSPYVTTYDWNGTEWVKRPDPASLPAGTGWRVALTPNGLTMAVAHANSPYVTTYDWIEGAWVKRPDPASFPAGTGRGVALTPDGLIMAVAHSDSPGVATYDWVNEEWVKRPDLAFLPTSANGVALTHDGSVMAVAHGSSPCVTTYIGLPFTQITFDTPPALGDAITADYTVDGVHKTDQYVIDVSFAIQFGEGV
jgi:hypothetical protein